MSPMLTLAANQWVVGGLVVLGIIASLLMILTILIQRPQGGGLAAAFGGAGAGSGQTAFGAKTGDALTIMTIVVFIFWLLVSMGLVYATKRPDAAAGAKQTAPAGDEQAPESGDPSAPPAPPAADSMDGARPLDTTEPASGDAPTETPAATPTTPPISPPETPAGSTSGGTGATGNDATKGAADETAKGGDGR